MKKLILLIILSFTGFAKAQSTFNYAYHNKSEGTGFAWDINYDVKNLVLINGYYYYSTVGNDAGGFECMYLYKISPAGNLIYRKKINGIYIIPYKLIKTLDDKLLFIGGEALCDVIPQQPNNYIMKLDTSGAITFTNSYAEDQGNFSKDVIQYSDSTYYVFTDSILYHYSKTGQFLMRKNTGLTNISSVVMDNGGGGIYVSAKKNSANAICTLDNGGTVTSTVSASMLFTKMDFYGAAQMVGLGTDGKIYRHSNGLAQLGVSNFASNVKVSDFVVKSDTMYCISNATVQSYIIADSALTVLHFTTTPSPGLKQQVIISVPNGNAGILTQALSKTTSNHACVTLNVFSKWSGNNLMEDVQLISIHADSSYATFSIPGQQYHTYLRAKVKVKNKGPNTLNSFKLNCYEYQFISCGDFYYQQNFGSVSVAPGDTVEVLTSFIHRAKSLFGPLQPTVSMPYCIFVTIPNSKADKNNPDNELCSTLTFTTDVSVKENSAAEVYADIFPNPFDSEIRLESNSFIKTVELYDQLGRVLFERTNDGKKAELELSNIPKGIYYLKIETEKGIAIKKVIKY